MQFRHGQQHQFLAQLSHLEANFQLRFKRMSWLVNQSNILKLKTLKVLCIQNAADPNNPGYAITGPIQAQSAQVDYFDCAVDQWKWTSYKETSGLKWMVGKIEGMQSKTRGWKPNYESSIIKFFWDGFHFRWLEIKGFDVDSRWKSISITLFFNSSKLKGV